MSLALKVVLSLLFLGLPALAVTDAREPNAPPTDRQGIPEEIRIEGERITKAGVENTVPAIILDDDAIRSAIPEVLTDALREARDVAVQVTTPGQGSPFIRGLTGSGVLNLVDGVRLNNAIYRAAPTPYVVLVEPRLVNQIEVVRGPASVRYGSDAMGGVIQLHTQRPSFEAQEWQTRSLFAAQFSSADLARGMRAQVEIGNADLGVRAGFSGLETGNLEGGGSTGRQVPSAYTALAGDFALLWKAAPDRKISFDVQYYKQPKTPRYDEMTTGFGQTQPSASEFYYEPLERLFGHLRYEDDRSTPYFDSFRFDVALQRIRDDRQTRDYESVIQTREQNTSELLGISASADKTFESGIRLNWGADAYLDWVSSHRQETNLTTDTTTSVPSRFPNGSTMNSYGLHADVSVDLHPALTLDGGVRYSFIDTQIAATGASPPGRGKQNDVTGSIGLLLQFWTNTEVIASFRRGFRAPNVFDLGTLGPRPGNRYNEPTSDLEPEVIYTADLGFRYLGETAQTEIFFYYSHYDDKIESISTGQFTPGGRDIVKNANTKEVRITGVEVFESVALSENGSLTFSFFWTWGEQSLRTGGFEPADRIPPLQGKIGFPWRLGERVRIEPYLRFAASQRRLSARDKRDPRINPQGTPSWATLNISGEYEWSDRVSLWGELRNLTNANYREHGSGIQAQGIGLAFSFRLVY